MNSRDDSTTGNENDRFNEMENKEEQTDDLETFDGSSNNFVPTLPRNFGLGRTSIRIENDRPQDIIELLGRLLGITDYETNMAAFWFLDILALQILRHEGNLDDRDKAVLISWLAAEMKLIRDRRLCRENFFGEMRETFNRVADEISRGGQLLSWDHIVSEERVIENETPVSLENKRSPSLVESKRRHSRKSFQKRSSKETTTRADKKSISESNAENEKSEEPEKCSESFSSVDPVATLNAIIESTYDVYGNEFRYGLIYAVYVESIEVRTYNLPFLLRTPGPIKLTANGKRGDNESEATPPMSLTDEEGP